MAITIDGDYIEPYGERMNCGGVPIFDEDSGCAYRCDQCMAIIGSVSQPRECALINCDVITQSRTYPE